jgi:hypothetical protein
MSADASDTAKASPRRFSLFPKTLSKTIEHALKPVYKKHGFAEHRIQTEWHLVVGPELAAFSIPQKLTLQRVGGEGGTLHILAASGRALELQHLQPLILDRIATYFGYRAVSRLKLTQTSSALFRKEVKTVKKRPDGERVDFAALAAGCDDEAVRKALMSLGTALAAVEK